MQLAHGDAAEAEQLAGRATQALKQAYGPDNPVVAATLALWARARLARGRAGEAARLLQRAHDAYRAHGGPDDPDARAIAALIEHAQAVVGVP
ncbi:MAG: tetratricopeptide repeat protein [Burkholderiaceae bacterium]|nr:tetratricopeptide repeat protein [Burkholderiaceae bacterium]